MKPGHIVFLISLFVVVSLSAQKPFLYKSFDDEKVNHTEIKKQLAESEYAHIGFTSTFSPGLKGNALNLTSDVGVRIPVALDSTNVPSYDKSFAISIWIQTKPGAQQGTTIISNKKKDEPKGKGWIIGTHTSGAWYFNASDGENLYNYEPTASRQAINDGRWHHIAISLDKDKKEIWFYFDGKNVAIYNIEALSGLSNSLKTIIGGSDEYNDWGSRREWTAFNGMVDEVKIYDRTITSADVNTLYKEFFTGSQYTPNTQMASSSTLKVQVWNIWHGGRRFGEHVGVERVIDVLKSENADLIGLIETYGSGAIIADSLGFYFYLISSNLSIMSRYPIENTIKLFKSFYSGGAIIDTGNNNKIAFVDVWLSASPDICSLFEGESAIPGLLEQEKDSRQKEIKSILSELKPYLSNTDNIPVFVVGDFNCGSHLDWNERTKEIHNGLLVDWQTSRSMIGEGFKDSFREMNPDPLKDPGFTWSPLINHATVYQNCIRDRIDFIYYKGKGVLPYYSKTIQEHPQFWPSDHSSVISYFLFSK